MPYSCAAARCDVSSTHRWMLCCRAEQFELVRRIPLPGYQLSFLVTNYHLERYSRDKLVDFIVKVRIRHGSADQELLCLYHDQPTFPCPQIVEGLGKQLSDSRLYLNTRNRAIVEHVWATIEASLPTATAT